MKLIAFLISQWKDDKYRQKLDGKILYVTSGNRCVKITSDDVEDVPELFSSQEEADTCMHICQYGYKSIIVSSMDTEVRMLCLFFCADLPTHMYKKCGTEIAYDM